jgi:hypothetical protein
MKALFRTITICFITTVAFAQAQIEKDFQGYWKLSEMSVEGTRINLAKSTIIFSKDREDKMSAQQKNNIEAKKAQVIKNLSQSHILVKGNNIDFVIADINRKGVYKIGKHVDVYKLSVAFEDGTNDEMIIYIKDKNLYITKSDDTDRDEMIFTHIL